MPEPLKSKDKNGAPFTRPAEIEACLGRLERRAAHWLAR